MTNSLADNIVWHFEHWENDDLQRTNGDFVFHLIWLSLEQVDSELPPMTSIVPCGVAIFILISCFRRMNSLPLSTPDCVRWASREREREKSSVIWYVFNGVPDADDWEKKRARLFADNDVPDRRSREAPLHGLGQSLIRQNRCAWATTSHLSDQTRQRSSSSLSLSLSHLSKCRFSSLINCNCLRMSASHSFKVVVVVVRLLVLMDRLVIISTNEMCLLIVAVAQIISSANANQRSMTEITCQTMFMEDAMFMYTQVTLVTNRQSTRHASLLA